MEWSSGTHHLGIILANQGKLFEGITAFLRAISLSPGYAEAYHNLGNALAAQNEPEKALAAFEEAKKLNPTNETAHHMVNALSGRQSPYPPRKFVRKLFDQYASFFERHLNALTYQALETSKQSWKNPAISSLSFVMPLTWDAAQVFRDLLLYVKQSGWAV